MPMSLFSRITLLLTHLNSLRKRQQQLDHELVTARRQMIPNAQLVHWLEVRRLMVSEQIYRHTEILQNLKAALQHGSARKVA